MLHSIIYRAGNSLIDRLVVTKVIGRCLEVFCRVYLRHTLWRRFVQSLDIDGVVDVGANFGEFLFLVRKSRPTLATLAIEPLPECSEYLRARGINVVEAALGSEEGEAVLSYPLNAPSTTATILPCDASQVALRQVRVRTLRLDSLELPCSRYLLKLDVQGMELQVLNGATGIISKVVAVIVECEAGHSLRSDRVRQWLQAANFEFLCQINQLYQGETLIEVDELWLRKTL